jgi:hypothetical protein
LIKEGDAICRAALLDREEEVVKYANENDIAIKNPSKGEREEAVTGALVPVLNREIEELDALGAPEGDEEQVEEIIASLEGAAGEIEAEPALAFEGEPLAESGELAKAYGFRVCGTG